MRNKIYYINFRNRLGAAYRIEMTPVDENANRETVLLSGALQYHVIPADVILTENLTPECAFEDKLPIGFALQSDFKLNLSFIKSRGSHMSFYDVAVQPLLSAVSQNPFYDGIQTKKVGYGKLFDYAIDELPPDIPAVGDTILTDGKIEIRSTGDVTIEEIVPSQDPQPYTYRQVWLAIPSDEAAFSITVYNRMSVFDGSGWVQGSWFITDKRSFLFGTPSGFEDIALAQPTRNGNMWRLIRMSDDYTSELYTVVCGAQRRIPSTEILETIDELRCEITVVDALRTATEASNIQELYRELPAPRAEVQTIESCSTNTTDLEYRLRTGHKYIMHFVSDLYNAIATRATITMRELSRRADAEVTFDSPATVKFYNHAASTSGSLSPTDGIPVSDLLFTTTVRGYVNGTEQDYAGVFSDKTRKAEESWDDAYSSMFDLLTDLASNWLCKHTVRYTGAQTAHVESLALYAQIAGQETVTLELGHFLNKQRTVNHGEYSVRGSTAQVELPHEDDYVEPKEFLSNSEREREESPRVLLHNIPSHATEIHPTLLQHNNNGTPAALADVVRIETGIVPILPRVRLYDFANTSIHRDLLVTNLQYESGLANALNRAVVAMFGAMTLTTIKGSVFTTAQINSSRVGAIVHTQLHNVSVDVPCVLISCADNIMDGTSEIELLGLIPFEG